MNIIFRTDSNTLLDLSNLKISFKGKSILAGVSFALEVGERVALVGGNGSGKTTILNILSGFIRPDTGRVLLQGRNVVGTAPHQIARLGIARSFQVARVLGSRTVLENLVLAMPPFELGRLIFAKGWATKLDVASRVRDTLEQLGLGDLAGQKSSDLSFGQRKAVDTLRAILSEERCMFLLDEPSAGIASSLKNRLARIFNSQLGDEQSFLLVEHDLEFARAVCGRVIVLNKGVVRFDGSWQSFDANGGRRLYFD